MNNERNRKFDHKNILYVRIDRKRKFLATVFLRALGRVDKFPIGVDDGETNRHRASDLFQRQSIAGLHDHPAIDLHGAVRFHFENERGILPVAIGIARGDAVVVHDADGH